MPTLTIRQLDQDVYDEFKSMATRAGKSMEAEARDMISQRVRSHAAWSAWIRATEPLRGDFPIPPRGPGREPPNFSSPEYG